MVFVSMVEIQQLGMGYVVTSRGGMVIKHGVEPSVVEGGQPG